MDDNECPICYRTYSRGLLLKDGKCNSAHKQNCCHYICVECCYEFGNILNNQIYEWSESNVVEIKCPLCREDWTDWILENYI